MDVLPLLRMLGALGVVLGLLVGALWIVRRFQIRLPGAVGVSGPGRRVELVERVAMDGRRSIALIRRDGREHLLLLAPEGHVVIETGILQDSFDTDAAKARVQAAKAAAEEAAEAAARSRAEFRAMVDRAVDRLDEVKQGALGKSRKRTADAASEEAPEAAPDFATLVETSKPRVRKARARKPLDEAGPQ